MPFTPYSFTCFLVFSFAAAYVQTLTGFAFGLLLMASITLAGVMPVQDAAVVIGLLTLANAVVVLSHDWRNVAARPLLASLLGALPMTLVGYQLLLVLAATSIFLLRFVLGAAIILSALQMLRLPRRETSKSSNVGFAAFGALGGAMNGLFSTSGPPLVYYFYRQSLPHPVIRETLVAVFATLAVARLLLASIDGAIDRDIIVWTVVGLPSVVAASQAAKIWPLPIEFTTLRQLVIALLFLTAIALLLPATL